MKFVQHLEIDKILDIIENVKKVCNLFVCGWFITFK